MLVLSRKVGERIVVGDKITITVVRMGQGNVRIGIDAPGDMTIVRDELLQAAKASGNRSLASAQPVAALCDVAIGD